MQSLKYEDYIIKHRYKIMYLFSDFFFLKKGIGKRKSDFCYGRGVR